MDIQTIKSLFQLNVPIKDGEWWNGMPDQWSNLPGRGLDFSQKFGGHAMSYAPMLGHNGIDIAGAEFTPIVFPCRLFTTYIGWKDEIKGFDADGYGNFVFAETDTKVINGEGVKLEMVFAHFSYRRPLNCQVYKWYNAGDLAGPMGTTGRSTGHHLHFGVRPLLRMSNGDFKQLFMDNGYRGYIDPEILISQHLVYDRQELINHDKFMAQYEKKIIVEGEGPGRKGIVINGKLREIKDGREAVACLYTLANNGLGTTVSSKDFDKLPRETEERIVNGVKVKINKDF